MYECWANRWYMEIPLSAHLFCMFKIVLKNSLLTTKKTRLAHDEYGKDI